MSDLDKIWSCAFDVCPTREHERFGDYTGAFVNVYVLADSADSCRKLAVAALRDDHFVILSEESEPFRLSDLDWEDVQQSWSAEFEAVAANLLPESPVQYGTFHAYPKGGLDA